MITILNDLNALGIQFISMTESVDTTIPTGKLLFAILGALGEFERDLIRERIMSGLARARSQNKKFGRPRLQVDVENLKSLIAENNSIRQIAKITGLSRQTINRVLAAQNGIENAG